MDSGYRYRQCIGRGRGKVDPSVCQQEAWEESFLNRVLLKGKDADAKWVKV